MDNIDKYFNVIDIYYNISDEGLKTLPNDLVETLESVNNKLDEFIKDNQKDVDLILDFENKYFEIYNSKTDEEFKQNLISAVEAYNKLSDTAKKLIVAAGEDKTIIKDLEDMVKLYNENNPEDKIEMKSFEIAEPETPKDKTPETGDSNSVALYSSLSALTLCIALIIYVLKLKKNFH